jgi:transcription antitermination factor NusA-like protein
MKTPFCDFCLKTNVLCKSCEERSKRNSTEFKVAKYLHDKFNDLDCELVSAQEIKDYCILFMKGEIKKIIGKEGKGVKEISKIANKKIKIIDLNSSREKIVEDLINPAKLSGISEVYGSKEIVKVVIPKSDLVKLPFDITSIERILSEIFKKETKISFG